MFGFFRRAKKDTEEKNNAKDKRSKDKQPSKDNPPQTNVSIDLCKNTSPQKPESALPSGNTNVMPDVLSESGLRECGNATGNFASADVTAKNEKEVTQADQKIETNQSKEFKIAAEKNTMETSQNGPTKHSPSPVTSYANIVKNDVQQRRSSVKPCGHGTVAITPKIPLSSKRDTSSSSTPPSSPDLDLGAKPKYRRVHSHELLLKKELLDSQKNGKIPHIDDPLSDTIRAAIKLKVDLPLPNSPKTANKSIPLANKNEGEALTKNLINQEAKFQCQLNDLSKQLSARDAEANKLRFQMEELQRDVFAKSAGMDRLQAELQSAVNETEYVRQRMKHVEEDLHTSKQKNSEISEEISTKTERFHTFQNNTNTKINEMQSTIRALRAKIESLEIQLDMLEKEKNNLEKQKVVLIQQRDEEKKALNETLENALQEKANIQKKWEEDFEKMRTVNILKEQEVLVDFEWKLREIEQTCKRRLQEKDKQMEDQLHQVYREAEEKIKDAERILNEVENLKTCEIEVKHLRGLTVNQQKNLEVLNNQLEQMKITEQSLRNESKKLQNMVELEKENLQHMQRVHNCEIVDKEKKLRDLMDEQKTAIAFYWENKLLQECRRLRTELDQLHHEERYKEVQYLQREKDREIEEIKQKYERIIQEHLKEIADLKRSLQEKDQNYQRQLEVFQTNNDRDILELRRLMDKFDMSHHEKFEKLVEEHEIELDNIKSEHERQIKEVEDLWKQQLYSIKSSVDLVRDEMENESKQKMQMLIDQHRSKLDAQWENLIHQKSEAVRLVEEEFVMKYKTLEEQFYTQQKSHENREVELLKTIDSLKNEVLSKDSAIEDLQNNVDTLEGGIQVLNQEMAYHGETVSKTKLDAEQKIISLQEAITKLQEQQQKEFDEQQMKYNQCQKQNQITIDHLQRKCQCLTKLFEEVRSRYERRESRQEDLNIISDLRQVIAEQENALTCLNEEKRYFQVKVMQIEKYLEDNGVTAEAVEMHMRAQAESSEDEYHEVSTSTKSHISIPPTIMECEDDFEDAIA